MPPSCSACSPDISSRPGAAVPVPLSLQGQSTWPWDAVVQLADRRGHRLELRERQRESAKPASPRVRAPEQGLGWDSWGYFSKGQTTVPGEEGKRTGEREGRSRRPLCVKAVSKAGSRGSGARGSRPPVGSGLGHASAAPHRGAGELTRAHRAILDLSESFFFSTF